MARLADPALAERRRREIVEAAMGCFRRRGFHQASMQEICAAAGMSPGALYRYFPSKSDIILAIAEVHHRDAEDLIAGIANGADVTENLVALVRDVVGRCGEDQPLTADVLAEAMRDPELARRFSDHVQHKQRRLGAAIAAGQRRGSVEAGIDPDTAARLVTVLMDGLVLRAAVMREKDPEILIAAFRAFVERLLKPAPKEVPGPQSRVSKTTKS